MDIRLKQTSYSSRASLQSCARKYQLSKYGVASNEEQDLNSQITFSFGSVVGLGVQLAWQDKSIEEITWEMFLAWEVLPTDESTKHSKSLWLAVSAIRNLISLRESGFLSEWRLLYWQGKPAVELSYIVDLGDGFNDRGFVDLVLENIRTGEVMVVECKTDSTKTISQAKYGNSTQALGYSVVLDCIKPGLNSFTVLYLIYRTELMEWLPLPIVKNSLTKAEWLNTVLLTKLTLELYEKFKFYPREGSKCNTMFGDCKYYGICNLSDTLLLKPITEVEKSRLLKDNEEKYQLKLNFTDLVNQQAELLEENLN